MDSSLPPPVVVADGAELRRLAAGLRQERRLAVDTESNSLYAYRERVCLIQLSTEAADYLIDPLAIGDLSPLAPALADPKIETVFHAAEYDLTCLWRDFGFRVAHLFDTRVAARTLGWKKTGLGDILEEAFGVKLNKRYQRANWGRRPLPEALLDYARLDTHYLLALRDRLGATLETAGRTAEALEECERLTQAATAQPPAEPEEAFWRIAHARHLGGRQAAVLRELHAMREAEAERRDVPPFKVMSDSALLALAQAAPRHRKALEAVAEVPVTLRDRYSQAILTAVEQGQEATPPARPPTRHADEDSRLRFQRLRDWRRRTASARGVESDVILPRDMAWEIARANPKDHPTLRPLMGPLQTRFDAFGEAILTALKDGRPQAGRGK